MIKAYENYHNTFMAETAALIDLFGGLLNGSRTADEVNQQADQHFDNLKDAATQYWELQNPDASSEAVQTTLCHAVAEGANLESLPCAGDDLPFEDLSRCGNCEFLEFLDNADRQQLKEEVRQAYLNGGRTGYLYDIDGNEYYITRDGIRHYTRLEG